jgi:hypothetical protein
MKILPAMQLGVCDSSSTLAIASLGAGVPGAYVEELSRRLGADPRELIPCHIGTKKPLVRGFARPGYSMNWDRILHGDRLEANVAMLFGSHSRFIGLDCDTSAAVERVRDLIPRGPYVRTARGTLLLAKSDQELPAVTGSAVLKMRLDHADSGELRLQRAYSMVAGLHPSGVRYSLEASVLAPIINLGEFVSCLRGRGFEFPELLPPIPLSDHRHHGEPSSDASFWCHEAACLSQYAPEHGNFTAGTDRFVVAMMTGLRTRPQLVGVVVAAFIKGVQDRGLTVRGGKERLLNELRVRLTRWSGSYGHRVTHKHLSSYFGPSPTEPHQDTQHVLVHFLSGAKMRSDYRAVVVQVGEAFIRRAREVGNQWRYESTRALHPMIPAKTFTRVVGTLVQAGLLTREKNTLPSTLPRHRTASWMFQCSAAAVTLIAGQCSESQAGEDPR